MGASKSNDLCCVFEIQHIKKANFLHQGSVIRNLLGGGNCISFCVIQFILPMREAGLFFKKHNNIHISPHTLRGVKPRMRGRVGAAITNINRWGDVHHDVSVVSFSLEDDCGLLQYCP